MSGLPHILFIDRSFIEKTAARPAIAGFFFLSIIHINGKQRETFFGKICVNILHRPLRYFAKSGLILLRHIRTFKTIEGSIFERSGEAPLLNFITMSLFIIQRR